MDNTKRSAPTNPHAHDPFYWLKTAKELDLAAMLVWAAIRRDLERLQASPQIDKFDLSELPYFNLGGVFWLNGGFALVLVCGAKWPCLPGFCKLMACPGTAPSGPMAG